MSVASHNGSLVLAHNYDVGGGWASGGYMLRITVISQAFKLMEAFPQCMFPCSSLQWKEMWQIVHWLLKTPYSPEIPSTLART